MGYDFEQREELELDAAPEQVWDAIATGPGVDSWLIGRSQIEPRRGGAVITTMGDGIRIHDGTVTTWDPPRLFAYRSGRTEAQDGRFIAYEFLLEARGGGSTVLRTVTSGFLPGDDWATEYEAMTHGRQLFVRTLVEYLSHFAGRTATPVVAFGPPVSDWDAAWSLLRRDLGLADAPTPGQRVRVAVDRHAPVDGVVYHVNPQTLGVRTDHALYRFLRGLRGPMIAAHHVFAEVDPAGTQRAWQAWLDRVLA